MKRKTARPEVVIDDVEDDVAEEELQEDVVEEEQEPESDTDRGSIVNIKYKINRNRGNQEHESVELEYQLSPNEDYEDVFNYLKDSASYLLDNESE